jgi:hypothetical protein
MDAPDDEPPETAVPSPSTHGFIIRIWVHEMSGEIPHYRGHLSAMSDTKIGAFNSLDSLLALVERTVVDRVKLPNRKDRCDAK